MNKLSLLKKKTMATLNSEVGLGKNSEEDQPTQTHSSHQSLQLFFVLYYTWLTTSIFSIFIEFCFGITILFLL